VILEDNESEATAASVLINPRIDLTFEPSIKSWYDIEDEGFADEDFSISPLERRGLASTSTSMPAQDQPLSPHHSLESSQDQIVLHENTSEELAAYTLLGFEDTDGEGWSNNFAELEKEMQQSIQGQEEVLSTVAPSSPRPSRLSIEPQIDQKDGQSGTSFGRLKELRPSSPLRRRDQEEPQEQQQRDPQGGKQQCQDGNREISSDNHHLEGSDCGHTTSDEDDEDPRPAKRRKLIPLPTLTPLNEPTSIHNGQQHHLPQTSRSSSATVESTPVADYHEWSFQGVLKRARIENQIIYNLEFTLPVQEHPHLSIHSAVLDTGFKEGLSAKATVSHQASAPQKSTEKLTEKEESLLVKMVSKDKTWAEIVENFPGHTLQSLKHNFFGKQGGKPRKRGRKPGVRL